MSVRVLCLVVPGDRCDELIRILGERDDWSVWRTPLADGLEMAAMVVPAGEVEGVLDQIAPLYKSEPSCRAFLLPVEATLPRLAEKPDKKRNRREANNSGNNRISREELFAEVDPESRITRVYLAMVVLSTIVAAVGLMRGDVAIIIGAMVIAPLLRPNTALALATTLADPGLARRAVSSSAVGIGLSLAIAVLMGMLFGVDPEAAQIATRTRVGLGDVALALAAGAAGALAFTSGAPAALTGVMVAVALLPPTVVLGLLLGSGRLPAAGGAGLLLLTNLIGINLSGVLTFVAQGVSPHRWSEAERARRSVMIAAGLWVCLLAALIGLLFVAGRTR